MNKVTFVTALMLFAVAQLAPAEENHKVTGTPKDPDTPSPELVRTLTGHNHVVRSLAFSPDGRTLASGGGQGQRNPGEWGPPPGELILWDVDTWEVRRTLPEPEYSVNLVAFSLDGKMVVGGGGGQGRGEVNLWDTQTGELRRTLPGVKHEVHSVAFSPDGKTLVSGEVGGVFIIWDAHTGETRRRLEGYAYSLAFTRDGRMLAEGEPKSVTLWDTQTWAVIRKWTACDGLVFMVAFSPDGKTLATACGHPDATIKLWDVTTGELKRTLKVGGKPSYSIAFSPDGQMLASAYEDRAVRL